MKRFVKEERKEEEEAYVVKPRIFDEFDKFKNTEKSTKEFKRDSTKVSTKEF